jgi:DNA helicase-4
MTSDTLGFPSGVVDDPVLQLAMPNADAYPNSEERRLFYVALTRAKKSVTLITQQGKESLFISELVGQHDLKVYDIHGQAAEVDTCPECGEGMLLTRKGKYGEFLGCSRFPRCSYTRDLGRSKEKTRSSG